MTEKAQLLEMVATLSLWIRLKFSQKLLIGVLVQKNREMVFTSHFLKERTDV